MELAKVLTLSDAEWQAVSLTLQMAGLVTILLLILATPLAWWLSRTRSLLKAPVSALVALPLVLPPTVLGFYFLLAMGPDGPIGAVVDTLGLSSLLFSFPGLVFASLIYSAPFVVQPLQQAMTSVDRAVLDAAATLRAGPVDRFFHVVLPIARPGYVTAAVLGFAHTVGEFGVVLMIGGNIPGETRVLSVFLYDQVEALQYDQAHRLAGLLLAFSFVTLLCLYSSKRTRKSASITVNKAL